nr:immunoglobulin heavy chain junction region [Macaca mulatta]MOX14547.1 immunoglobulin heavy chain junction region [Macaca mulatta]MOX14650.1 immunoglobulin heavy chain junction region [Macaca mulatta]MOX14699.1 immunoglobulin heavy chain junction region [Macaca mulatta]MOX14848.1 immunoglobulin heavy chain junction region [Macaca mulatta]
CVSRYYSGPYYYDYW